ncbi:Nif11-like leader peptide family natural product precursor [Synechococcus sp. UW179A]|uniref:Nif11-like leader peptide family natural product precursor n=1 Tax=Synechococcus sp. UW179A TaxID=2575510 RepID=UPI000E0EC22F|nr:Nif11-like leader peptide family natural product precursor [Synechococcus sp. UW179A]
MSEAQLKAFLEKVKGDTSLQEKLQAANSPEDVIGIAKEHGHEFTAEKLSKLSENELEGVSGGGRTGWVCSVLVACGNSVQLECRTK